MEFEEFWKLLSKELKKPKTFSTVTGKQYKAVFEGNKIRFIFNDQPFRVEYKNSFEQCFNLYLTTPKRHEYRKYTYNASYILPILHFYLK